MDTLIKCLPQFTPENIKEVYEKFHSRKGDNKDDGHGVISINCS